MFTFLYLRNKTNGFYVFKKYYEIVSLLISMHNRFERNVDRLDSYLINA